MSPRRIAAIVSVTAICGVASASPDWSYPISYSQFDTTIASGDGAALTAAISEGVKKYIYLQPGTYTLANPVVVSRTTALVIHGADAENVNLVAQHPREPLFVISAATLVQFANLRLLPDSTRATSPTAVLVETRTMASLELFNIEVDTSRILLRGAALLRCQNCLIAQGGVSNPIIIDHPEADALFVGGDMTSGSQPAKIPSELPDHYHVWQKHGRLRLYGTTTEGGRGQADFRFDTTSPLGPHIIADVRTEGQNGLKPEPYPPALAYVPPFAPVDLVLKNVGILGVSPNPNQRSQYGYGTAAIYNGSGKLWLFGVIGTRIQNLVSGNTSAGTIVAAGNATFTNLDQFPLGENAPAHLYLGDNIYNYICRSGSGNYPWSGEDTRCVSAEHGGTADWEVPHMRFWTQGQKLQLYPSVPAPPIDTLPRAISWPVMDVKLPGFLDVQADFKAKGNGKDDDTTALQKALDYQCTHGGGPAYLYLPPGTYKTTARLSYNSQASACHNLSRGGWIAGAGRDLVKIVRSTSGAVFWTGSMGFLTMQGVEFDAADRTQGTISVESERGLTDSIQDVFIDIRTRGGWAGISFGDSEEQINDNAMLIMNSTFLGATYGCVFGHPNVLAEVALGITVQDSDYSFGTLKRPDVDWGGNLPGGTFFAYDSHSIGARIADYDGPYGPSAVVSFRGYTTDAAVLNKNTTNSGTAFGLQYEQAAISPRASVIPVLNYGQAAGIVFLDTKATRLAAKLDATFTATYLLSLYSTIPDFAATTLVQPARHAPQAQTDAVARR